MVSREKGPSDRLAAAFSWPFGMGKIYRFLCEKDLIFSTKTKGVTINYKLFVLVFLII